MLIVFIVSSFNSILNNLKSSNTVKSILSILNGGSGVMVVILSPIGSEMGFTSFKPTKKYNGGSSISVVYEIVVLVGWVRLPATALFNSFHHH